MKRNNAQLTQKEGNNITDTEAFKPTPYMQVWLNKAAELETDNISEISRGCDIERRNWYNWLAVPGFIEWFNREWDRRLQGHGWRLDVIGFKKSKKEYKYWEGMQRIRGKLQDRPNMAQQININSSPKDLDELELKEIVE